MIGTKSIVVEQWNLDLQTKQLLIDYKVRLNITMMFDSPGSIFTNNMISLYSQCTLALDSLGLSQIREIKAVL